MKNFVLLREKDISGISGTGIVAEGTEFSDGAVTLRWIVGNHRSTVIYSSIIDVEKIHGHVGATTIIYCNTIYPLEEAKKLFLKIVSVFIHLKATKIYDIAITIFPESLLKSTIRELILEDKLIIDYMGRYIIGKDK